jgi:hypothetical protein
MRTHAALGLILVLCGTALGQNALDKPLDRNTRVGGGGVNQPRPDLTQELRLRNAIVTGNAPGGFSFRGDVGYRAPGEFFGSLGSNETFSFRRDSYYSGLGGLGIRGTDALQYQFAMTTGNAPPPGFLGAPTFSRSGAAVPVQANEPASGQKITPDSGLRRETPDGTSLMSLRSPSAFAASRSLEPMMIARQGTADGRVLGISASPLLGLAVTERQKDQDQNDQDKSSANSVSSQIDPRTGEVAKEPLNKQDNKINTEVNASAYDELMARIKAGGEEPDKPADPTKGKPAWQVQLDELRKQLGGSPTRDGAPKRARPGETPPPRPGDARPGEVQPGGTRPGEPDKTDKPKEDLDPTAIERIRNAAGDVRELAAKGFDGYAEHMAVGQEHIAAGRFFYAEERFTAALSLKPGDPMAAIGRVHAQLGAGMFLSAAINLRSLFTEHPEVVGLKYQPSLLPPADRIQILEERLVELSAPRNGKHRDLGLLMAYLAFQRGKTDGINQGLALMSEPPVLGPEDKPLDGPDQLQKLSTMLSKVWLRPASPPPAAPASATPPPAVEPNK